MPRKDDLMETMKRWITLLLVAALLLGIPMVSGEEISTDTIVQEEGDLIPEAPASNVEYTGIQVNPRFAHIISAADCQLPEFPSDSADAAEPMAGYYFTSQAEAERQIRDSMKQRTAVITVYVKGPLNKTTKQTAHDMMNNAMAHTGKPKEGDYLLWHYSSWKAKITTAGSDYIYEYTVEYNTTAQQEQQVDNAVQSLIWQLGVSYKSDYEKVKGVYDYICANITYDHTNPDTYKLKHTAYAAIIDKTAVCQGYALLFYRMMLEMGVDCRLVAGIGNGGAHGWNIVKLDGVYYNVDSTWDAGLTDYNYFLVNTWNFLDHTRYLEYETWEFHDTHPMAEENYTPGQKGKIDPNLTIGMCGDSAVYLMRRDGTLEIGGTGAVDRYHYYANNDQPPWYQWRDHVKKLIINDGITATGQKSFYQMHALTEIVLADTVKKISSNSFEYCTALKQIKWSENLVSINDSAFGGCDSLTNLTFPASLTGIGEDAFRGCSSLTELTIPGTITYLSGFKGCENLTTVTIEEGVTSVEAYAFAECPALKNLTLPDSLIRIENQAFYRSGLEELNLPNNLEYIGRKAFEGVKLDNLVIPSSVKTICWDAFYGASTQKELTISANVEELSGFREWNNLETVYLFNKGVIWSNAFQDCDNLRNVFIGSGLTEIYKSAFYDCNSLTSIYIPENVTIVSGFGNCNGLESAYINCETLEDAAFQNCTALKTIDFGSNLTCIEDVAFRNCSSLEELELPDTVTFIGHYAFADCTGLRKITLPKSLQKIDYNAFSNCPLLTEITVPASVTYIASEVFEESGITVLRFVGDAPEFVYDSLEGITATAYYPAGNPTWTEDKLQNYGGNITWMPFDSRVDLNGDLVVDDGDVEVLLWHTLFPEAYPISINADLTKDGQVDDADVEFLLWHVLFPDAYPIN